MDIKLIMKKMNFYDNAISMLFTKDQINALYLAKQLNIDDQIRVRKSL